MAVRVLGSFQFFSYTGKSNLVWRPFTNWIKTIMPQQRKKAVIGSWRVPRPQTWCYKSSLKFCRNCRYLSLSTDNDDKDLDNSVSTDPTEETNTFNTTNHSIGTSNPENITSTSDDTYRNSSTGQQTEDVDQHVDSDNVTREGKGGSLDLSKLTWSDDGIVIYPNIHFKTNQAVERTETPSLTTWQDDIAKSSKEFNIHSLLHNIQKSRSKEKEVVVRERRSTVMTAEEIVEFLREQNAKDIVVIELPPAVDYVRYFIVCSGMGTRHIGRMADSVVEEMRGVRLGRERRKVKVEGRDCDDWMAVDLGSMVIHFMLEDIRRRFELEKLWALGEEYDDQSREMKAFLLDEEEITAHAAGGGDGGRRAEGRTVLSSHDQENMPCDQAGLDIKLSHDQAVA